MIENPQYINRDKISIIVVMNGLAITAGSSLHFFAISGSIDPTILDSMIVAAREIEITSDD